MTVWHKFPTWYTPISNDEPMMVRRKVQELNGRIDLVQYLEGSYLHMVGDLARRIKGGGVRRTEVRFPKDGSSVPMDLGRRQYLSVPAGRP